MPGALVVSIFNSTNDFCVHITSIITVSKTQNSTILDDLDITLCYPNFHETSAWSKKIQNPTMLRLSFGLVTQPVSMKACNSR